MGYIAGSSPPETFLLSSSGVTLDNARELVMQLLAAVQTTNTSEPEKPGEA